VTACTSNMSKVTDVSKENFLQNSVFRTSVSSYTLVNFCRNTAPNITEEINVPMTDRFQRCLSYCLDFEIIILIHYVVCLAIGPYLLPKLLLPRVPSSSCSRKFH